MKRTWNKALAVFMAAACMAAPFDTYAVDEVLTADYKNHRYTLDMEIGRLFDIPNIEFGKEYTKTLEFQNESPKTVRIQMINVINDIEDSRLYNRSLLTVKINGQEVYDGDMHSARWERSVRPGGSLTVEYIYSIRETEHIPDNSWMGAEMKSTFVFVGEYEASTDGGWSGGSIIHTPDRTPQEETRPQGDVPGDENKADDTAPQEESSADVVIKLPPTGDNSHPLLLLGICAASAGGIVITAKSNKKRRK